MARENVRAIQDYRTPRNAESFPNRETGTMQSRAKTLNVTPFGQTAFLFAPSKEGSPVCKA
jgi:hypothetical protein